MRGFYQEIKETYFEWLFDLVSGERFAEGISHRKLLRHLHDTEFIFTISRDGNRAEDGVDLRYRFVRRLERLYYGATIDDLLDCLEGPCSILEMMVALAIRIEESIMDDPDYGDRTSQWFWGMIVNLGLGSQLDEHYDEDYVNKTLDRFLERDYEPNGKGGLFTVRHCDSDLRNVEIWYQANWYLDEILGV